MHKPRLLTIEHNNRDGEKNELIRFFKNIGYIPCFSDHSWLLQGDIWLKLSDEINYSKSFVINHFIQFIKRKPRPLLLLDLRMIQFFRFKIQMFLLVLMGEFCMPNVSKKKRIVSIGCSAGKQNILILSELLSRMSILTC